MWLTALKKDPVRWAHYRAKRKQYDKEYAARYPERVAEIQRRAREKFKAKTATGNAVQLVGERIQRVGNRTIHRLLDDEAIS